MKKFSPEWQKEISHNENISATYFIGKFLLVFRKIDATNYPEYNDMMSQSGYHLSVYSANTTSQNFVYLEYERYVSTKLFNRIASACEKNPTESLLGAIIRNEVEVLKSLVDCNALINEVSLNGDFPVHYAAELAKSEDPKERAKGYAALDLLKDKGADLTVRNGKNETVYDIVKPYEQALMEIATDNIGRVADFFKLAKNLLTLEKEVMRDGHTLLTKIIPDASLKMINFLIKSGFCSVKNPNAYGDFPVHCAAALIKWEHTAEKGYKVLNLLRNAGANLHEKDGSQKTAYEVADISEENFILLFTPTVKGSSVFFFICKNIPSEKGVEDIMNLREKALGVFENK